MTSYQDRPWIKNYDTGIPADAEFPNVPVYGILDDAVANHPDRAALVASADLPLVGRKGQAVSFKELGEASDSIAAALVAMGLKKGDRVAIVGPNSVQFVVAWWAVLKAGGIVVALNPSFPPEKWKDQINDSGARIAVSMTLFYDALNSVRDETSLEKAIVYNIKEYLPPLARTLFTLAKEKKEGHYVESLRPGDMWYQDAVTTYPPSQRPQIDINPVEDTAIFQYTGGTTGFPKAARSPHRALVANAYMMKVWLGQGDDALMGAIPFFHVYGMVAVMIFAAAIEQTIYLCPNARDIDDVINIIDHYKPTLFHAVPALYNAINNHPDVMSGKVDLTSIRGCISGSAPLPSEVKRRFEEITGSVVMEGFGMSECPTATHCNPMQGNNKTGSIGMPLPGVKCRIVSLDDEVSDVGIGEVGELLIQSPNLMTGYHNMPTETANALRDGWLYTGDIARMDEEGYFYIVDRKKDMVLVGGFNTYPNQIEEYLMTHPAILECGVAGIPHPEKPGQEALKAWIVVKPDQSLTREDLIAFCEKKLAKYEIPRRMEFVDAIPRSAVGKILRRELIRMEMETREGA